ncbi:hypothetical protein WA158_007850 [Blastocystis sp. Blastoise]
MSQISPSYMSQAPPIIKEPPVEKKMCSSCHSLKPLICYEKKGSKNQYKVCERCRKRRRQFYYKSKEKPSTTSNYVASNTDMNSFESIQKQAYPFIINPTIQAIPMIVPIYAFVKTEVPITTPTIQQPMDSMLNIGGNQLYYASVVPNVSQYRS